VCKCVPPPGDNPIAVNKYIISYIISLNLAQKLFFIKDIHRAPHPLGLVVKGVGGAINIFNKEEFLRQIYNYGAK